MLDEGVCEESCFDGLVSLSTVELLPSWVCLE